jgi:hypothetical protein
MGRDFRGSNCYWLVVSHTHWHSLEFEQWNERRGSRCGFFVFWVFLESSGLFLCCFGLLDYFRYDLLDRLYWYLLYYSFLNNLCYRFSNDNWSWYYWEFDLKAPLNLVGLVIELDQECG